ncbi:MAG: hypothetical protein JW741_28010 [Sedimentisphaerales bacterium]|nr:hypothetical protein [Sedimentisphaerales bacterium]
MDRCLRLGSLRLGVFCLAILTCACTPPWDGGNGGPGSGQTGPLAPTVALADEASDEFGRICDEVGWPAGRDQFVAYARSLDGVEHVNVDADSDDVTVEYASSVLHVFHVPDNEEEDVSAPVVVGSAGAGAARSISARRVEPAVLAMSIPGVPRATMATSHNPWSYGYSDIEDALGVVRRACEHAGYDVPDTPPQADVEWFRSWGNYGVIFFQGHGNICTVEEPDGNIQLFAMQTTNHYFSTGELDSTYTDDLTSHRVVYSTIELPNDRELRVLAVTKRFFERYCNPMQDGAVIYINSCRGLENPDDLPATLCDLGAEMVLGWGTRSPEVYSAEMAELLFDLGSGLNEVAPTDPGRRPFAVDEVYDFFVDQGATAPIWVSRQTGETRVGAFDWYRGDPAVTATSLRPIITSGWFVPAMDDSLVHLSGFFGDGYEDVEVSIGGTEIDLVSAGEDRVFATTPRGLVGDIIVRTKGLDSNPLRLTQYSGSLTLNVADPRGRWAGTVDATFSGRGIVQRVHDEINGEPHGLAVPPVTQTRLWLDEEFDMTWDISGNWEDTCGSPTRTEFHNVTASGRMDEGDLGAGIGDASFSVTVDLDLDAGLGTGSSAVEYQIEYFVRIDGIEQRWGCTSEESSWGDVYRDGPLPAAPAGLDTVVPGGSYTDPDGEYVITWSAITPDQTPPVGD